MAPAFAMLESLDGDLLFAYGRKALFHLSADHATLRSAVGGGSRPSLAARALGHRARGR